MKQNDFELAMLNHFKDDEKNFGEQNKKIDKITEQMVINGEHLSHLNKNMAEIKYEVRSLKEDLKATVETVGINKGRLDEHDKLVFGVKMSTWAVGAVISLLLVVIGYTFNSEMKHTQEAIGDLKEQISKLK